MNDPPEPIAAVNFDADGTGARMVDQPAVITRVDGLVFTDPNRAVPVTLTGAQLDQPVFPDIARLETFPYGGPTARAFRCGRLLVAGEPGGCVHAAGRY